MKTLIVVGEPNEHQYDILIGNYPVIENNGDLIIPGEFEEHFLFELETVKIFKTLKFNFIQY